MSGRFDPVAGVARVALGRADGVERFGGTVQSFLASLAPLVAFPLAGALIELIHGGFVPALSLLLVTLVAQLAPLVLSHALAARWGREPLWLRYATAYNWCYWALPVIALAFVFVLGIATTGGLPEMLAARMVVIGLGAYSLWLHWFLARHALHLTRGKAALLVVLVNAGTLALAFAPALLAS